MNQGISYTERLKSKKDTERLFKEGVHFFKHPVKAIVIFSDVPLRSCALLVTVPKKKFKSSVNRNRGKRLLREAYRLQKQFIYTPTIDRQLTSVAMLALIYVSHKPPVYAEVKTAVGELLQKIAAQAAPV